MGCSSERKLSHVETRLPAEADARLASQISPFRRQMARATKLPMSCPAEVRELLAPLSLERVKYPPCGEGLAQAFQVARGVLGLDEISAVEELINSRCHLNPRDPTPDTLEALLRADRSIRRAPAPSGDEATAPVGGAEGETHLREELRKELVASRETTKPIDQWQRNNGEFVLPEEQLTFLDRLAVQDGCRMTDQEVDFSYRTLRSLEDLAGIEPENDPQRATIERFLKGVHTVIDRKIQEYFRR